ncbi:Uncharacterised protein [Mycobacterium tuberculosis]|nr:Uncharacterised protein [Mycobacterium tuberculosis]
MKDSEPERSEIRGNDQAREHFAQWRETGDERDRRRTLRAARKELRSLRRSIWLVPLGEAVKPWWILALVGVSALFSAAAIYFALIIFRMPIPGSTDSARATVRPIAASPIRPSMPADGQTDPQANASPRSPGVKQATPSPRPGTPRQSATPLLGCRPGQLGCAADSVGRSLTKCLGRPVSDVLADLHHRPKSRTILDHAAACLTEVTGSRCPLAAGEISEQLAALGQVTGTARRCSGGKEGGK